MSDEPLAFSPDQFSGQARMFPLPNLVMFPHVMQALHIFEPRYRALLEESLADDRLMALGVLAPGWEHSSSTRPAVHPMACLCRIATHQRTPQGTYNVLLLGVRRLRLREEVSTPKPFRVVAADILEDDDSAAGSAVTVAEMQRRLLAAFKRAMPRLPDAQGQLDQLLGSQITLGMLTDIVAYTIDIDMPWKLRLLAETDVLRRTDLLLEALASRGRVERAFPPPFSVN
ncbi:MAG: peptidase S16 [Planctomycetia bacterium]|nr:peptidase S16 [Planctomycetia bacterium]